MPTDVLARHRPKSPIFRVPSNEKKMFDGCRWTVNQGKGESDKFDVSKMPVDCYVLWIKTKIVWLLLSTLSIVAKEDHKTIAGG